MAKTTPRSYYYNFVEPNYQDYLETPDDLRKGFNATVPAFQMADVFYAYYERKDRSVIAGWPSKRQLLEHLTRIEPSFLTVQSVATAYKHLYAIGGFYEVSTAGAVARAAIPGDKIKIESDWNDGMLDLQVSRRDGSKVSLRAALARVVEHMWPAVLPDE